MIRARTDSRLSGQPDSIFDAVDPNLEFFENPSCLLGALISSLINGDDMMRVMPRRSGFARSLKVPCELSRRIGQPKIDAEQMLQILK